MCIKIVNAHCEVPYDASKPLEDQIQGFEQIVVNYDPSDRAMDQLLAEVQRMARTGLEANLSIKVIHNNHIFGFRLKQQIARAKHDINLNEIIKLMVLAHCSIDRKLENLAETFNGKVNEQQKA